MGDGGREAGNGGRWMMDGGVLTRNAREEASGLWEPDAIDGGWMPP